jgi:protein-disulfide isomerase
MLAIVGGAVILIGLIIFSFAASSSKVDFIMITPVARPQESGTAMGDPNAPVRLDVFEDFQCPACQYFALVISKQVMNELVASGKVYYVFHQYPFIDDYAATRESDQSANASLCAAEQGRFWDYHDMLYTNWKGENIGYLTDELLMDFAKALKLDMKAFKACFTENRYKAQIEADLADAKKMGVSGTPSVFVNGKLITPGKVPTFEDIKAAVDAALSGQ